MMQPIRSGLRWTMQKLRNLRALVKDEDHDSLLDDHPSSEKKKSPNIGPNLGGGGGGS